MTIQKGADIMETTDTGGLTRTGCGDASFMVEKAAVIKAISLFTQVDEANIACVDNLAQVSPLHCRHSLWCMRVHPSIRMHMSMYMHVDAHVWTHLHVHIYALVVNYAHADTHTHTHACTHAYPHLYTHVQNTCICLHVYMLVCTCACTCLNRGRDVYSHAR